MRRLLVIVLLVLFLMPLLGCGSNNKGKAELPTGTHNLPGAPVPAGGGGGGGAKAD